MIKAIVGANWGDEGKGKITDMLAAEADIVIRFQGGSNAGHTIINDYGKFALHQMPSGIFNENTVNIIGTGVAFNIPYFVKELNYIKESGIKNPKIMISDRVQILMPYHVDFDTYEEASLIYPYMQAYKGQDDDSVSMGHMNLNSSYKDLIWSGMNPIRITSIIPQIKEIDVNYAVIELDYVTMTEDSNGETDYYSIREYYRVS